MENSINYPHEQILRSEELRSCTSQTSEITNNKHQCQICNKFLSSKQNLREHKFVHTGELPYICKTPGCGLRFRQGSVLSSHKKIHNIIGKYMNEKSYH